MKGALLIVLMSSVLALAQVPSEADLQAAMERGKAISSKKLWESIRKKQGYRMNRAGLDPIEKKILILSDLDRVALEASEAKRQLREITIDEIKKNLTFGVIEVLLEANCYNSMYSASLPKWGPEGGVHMVLKVGDKIIQPLSKREAKSDSVSVLAQQTGVVARQGNVVTYTPLYQTTIYERASQRAWFTFPAIDEKTFIVTAISGDGKQKEKEVGNPR